MLLTISTTHTPASDLGYLMHKHPDKFQTVELKFGKAHIFYPIQEESQSCIALLLEIDPIEMIRSGRNMGGEGFALGHYVNDRPYVASSFMSVAISKAFSSALNGHCKERPELVDQAMPLQASLSMVPVPAGGEFLLRKLFEPLGYDLQIQRAALDSKFPQWGDSKYYALRLSHTLTIKELLSHLYVLIPVLDLDKHYFVGEHEIEKLLNKGEGWLKDHPEKEQIIKRYLINLNSLTRKALERLHEEDVSEEIEEPIENEVLQIAKESLHNTRLHTVAKLMLESGAQKVIDLGCGEGKLLSLLLKHAQFKEIAGMDISYQELLKARKRLHFEEMAPKQRDRIQLFQGSLTYKDKRLEGYEGAALVEVIEHLEPNRLKDFERVVFEFAKPKMVWITTPNREYNVQWEKLSAQTMRHHDHRFEWDRKEFEEWANDVAKKYGYSVEFSVLGEEMPSIGGPSQMGFFKIKSS